MFPNSIGYGFDKNNLKSSIASSIASSISSASSQQPLDEYSPSNPHFAISYRLILFSLNCSFINSFRF